MNFAEFLGFVISVLALIVISYKKAQDEKKRREHPEEYAREQSEHEKRLKELLGGLEGESRPRQIENEDEFDEDEEEDEYEPIPVVQPPPKPVVTAVPTVRYQPKIERLKMQIAIESHHLKSKLESRYQQDKNDEAYLSPYESKNYDAITSRRASKASELLSKLPSKKNMVILHEVFGPPKGLK